VRKIVGGGRSLGSESEKWDTWDLVDGEGCEGTGLVQRGLIAVERGLIAVGPLSPWLHGFMKPFSQWAVRQVHLPYGRAASGGL